MIEAVHPFSDEQLRVAANLQQHYETWIETERALAALPYGMLWKTVSGRSYLYAMADRRGNGTSLGPRSPETEARYQAYQSEKARLQDRRRSGGDRLAETCRLYRALRLPMIASEAAKILREADRRQLLGSHLLVIGTNAMAAYALEAGGRIGDAPDATDDFDLAWAGREEATDDIDDRTTLWGLLKAVDATYTVNTERTFQARNSKAYEVEVLAAPSRIEGLRRRRDRPVPVPLPEQEWLLLGEPLGRVVVARDASPARIVAPDPRWFALQKLWLADQAKRDSLKRRKDSIQGAALLSALREAMPRFGLDRAFESGIPDELLPYYEAWKTGTAGRIERDW
ncbi:MAG: GSU2403 family nucleotidyltransferase fold protein [Thalassobaculum sp.]